MNRFSLVVCSALLLANTSYAQVATSTMVTKSGTNQVKGVLYNFLRNDAQLFWGEARSTQAQPVRGTFGAPV